MHIWGILALCLYYCVYFYQVEHYTGLRPSVGDECWTGGRARFACCTQPETRLFVPAPSTVWIAITFLWTFSDLN